MTVVFVAEGVEAIGVLDRLRRDEEGGVSIVLEVEVEVEVGDVIRGVVEVRRGSRELGEGDNS